MDDQLINYYVDIYVSLINCVNVFKSLQVFPKIQAILSITYCYNTEVPAVTAIPKQAGNSYGILDLIFYIKES